MRRIAVEISDRPIWGRKGTLSDCVDMDLSLKRLKIMLNSECHSGVRNSALPTSIVCAYFGLLICDELYTASTRSPYQTVTVRFPTR